MFGDHTADLFPFFVLGYYVAEHKSIVEKIYKCRYIAYIAFIVLLIGMREEYFVYVGGINPVVSEYGFAKQVYFDLYRLIIGILGSSTIIMLVMQIGKYLPSAVNKFFEAMGRVTLQLYVLQSFFLEGVLSQLINHLPLSGGGQSYIFLMEWGVAPIIAIVYAVILKIGVKIIGKVPHLSTALFGVKN